MLPCVCRFLVPRIWDNIVTFPFQSKQSTRNSQYIVYETIYCHSGDGISTERCVWAVLAMTCVRAHAHVSARMHTHTHTHSTSHLLCWLFFTNWRPLKMIAIQSFGKRGTTHPMTQHHHPKRLSLRQHSRQNLKTHTKWSLFIPACLMACPPRAPPAGIRTYRKSYWNTCKKTHPHIVFRFSPTVN
jgi:hypothetical protein